MCSVARQRNPSASASFWRATEKHLPAPLDGSLSREEACGLASSWWAGRRTTSGFTRRPFPGRQQGSRGFLPSVRFISLHDRLHIHSPPPSRALPRATPGCTGCAKRGWRRTSLGLRPATSWPASGSAVRRPSPPGVARGLAVAATAVANIRARRGRRALIFDRLGPVEWPGAALGRRVPELAARSHGDRNGHRPAGAGRWPRTTGAVRPTGICQLNAWQQHALGCSTGGCSRE